MDMNRLRACTSWIASPWGALLALLSVGLVFSIAWTALALDRNNVDRQGIDIIHHALILHQLTVPGGISEHYLGHFSRYPMGSHELARLFLPCFGNDTIQALRCAALFSLLTLLAVKWVILRQMMRPAAALLVLITMQALFIPLRVADVNHFLWVGQYNFSRAVGAGALLLLVYGLAVPPFRGRLAWGNDVLWIGLAGYALGCHATPGVIAFGLLGWYYLQDLREQPLRGGLIRLAALGAAAVALFFGTNAFAMMKYVGEDGWMPVRAPWWLFAAWFPTWLVMSCIALSNLWRPRPGHWSDGIGRAVLCGMVSCGVLQAYLTFSCVLGRAAPYTVKSTLFVTMAMSVLVWVHATMLLIHRWQPPMLQWWDSRRFSQVVRLTAGVAAVVGLVVLLKRDVTRPYYGPDRDPVHVARALGNLREEVEGYMYYDPNQPHGSVFVNTVALNPRVANFTKDAHRAQLRGILLPRDVGPAQLNMEVRAVPFGPFLKCEIVRRDSH